MKDLHLLQLTRNRDINEFKEFSELCTRTLKLLNIPKLTLCVCYLRLVRFGRVDISSEWSTPPPRAW